MPWNISAARRDDRTPQAQEPAMSNDHTDRPTSGQILTPEEQEHRAFGHYISGLTDAEGCFLLSLVKSSNHFQGQRAVAAFQIGLRDDDRAILDKIQERWGVGKIYTHNSNKKNTNANPSATLIVKITCELINVIIPHFELFPLRSKKSRDFIIWRQGVELIRKVQKRPARHRKKSGGNMMPKWTDLDRVEYTALCDAIRQQRQYETGGSSIPLDTLERPDQDYNQGDLEFLD